MLPFAPAVPDQMPMMDQQPPLAGAGLITPDLIFSMLQGMGDEFKPKIPPGYKKEKKPEAQAVWTRFTQEESRHAGMVARMMDTVRRLRFDVAGLFPADKAARELGDQDPWISSALVDDYNLLTAILASMDESYVKQTLQRSMRTGAQAMEDAARLFREEMEYRWANTGDMPFRMAEAKTVAAYGKVVWRVLCNLEDPDFPFDVRLIDPASVYTTGNGIHGPRRVYRAMRMTIADAYAEWGEPKKEDRDKLANRGGTDDDGAFITICEYADCTWRMAVTHDGIELLPAVEHKYYENPFLIQGGPAGEPLFTDTARANTEDNLRVGNDWWHSGPGDDWGLEHKLVSSITLQQERHDQLEAVMSRIVTSLQDSANPALVITRDTLSFGTPLPRIDRRRGRVSEIGMGEAIQAVPTQVNPSDLQSIMAAATQDRQTGAIPLGMYGAQPGSNITGNSMSVAAESGMDHITPWIQALETGRTRLVEKMFRIWRNEGHLTRFAQGEERPFLIPMSKPSTNQELAQALTPELLDNVGPGVKVVMSRLRVQEAMQWVNIAAQAIPLGIMTKRRGAEKIGETDYDRLREEWQEEADWDAMNADETLMKEVRIPMQIKQWADQATDPETRALYMAFLDFYMEQRQQEMMAQQQQALMPSGGAPGSGAPPPLPPGTPPGSPAIGPGGNTLNMAGLGAPPGSAGQPVGRPPGPFGPPGV
jgi:hypothetical protein